MALVHTPAPEMGKACPDFVLPAVDGKTYSLKDFAGAKALVVMFICNHCPYVKAIEDRLIQLGRDMASRGASFVAICSNDGENYPEDSFENLKRRWKERNYPFAYLHDESQSVARDFGAVCTPDFFIYNSSRELAYRGRLDDSWKDASNVKTQDLKLALEQIIKTGQGPAQQVPSMGCSIKWLR